MYSDELPRPPARPWLAPCDPFDYIREFGSLESSEPTTLSPRRRVEIEALREAYFRNRFGTGMPDGASDAM